jgi:hypothetical protein
MPALLHLLLVLPMEPLLHRLTTQLRPLATRLLLRRRTLVQEPGLREVQEISLVQEDPTRERQLILPPLLTKNPWRWLTLKMHPSLAVDKI